MANQYKITSANATSNNIVITAEFKRDPDIEAVRVENISYGAGTLSETIIADLEARAKSAIAVYENDVIAVKLLETTKNDWVTVVEPAEKPI